MNVDHKIRSRCGLSLEAIRVAKLTGERNRVQQHFGPTNVNVWRVAIGVELGQGPAAAERVEREPIDLSSLGSEAVRYVDTADRIAPTGIRNDPIAGDLVAHPGPAGSATGVRAGQLT
ncbi:MAG: hypothetical protein ACRDQ4_09480 [Pseudonocardiaceae bacterium]